MSPGRAGDAADRSDSDILVHSDCWERLVTNMPFDPARPHVPPGPLLDALVREHALDGVPGRSKRLRLMLTHQAAGDAAQAAAAAALRGYCVQRTRALAQDVASIRHRGWSALRLALLVLGASLACAAAFERLQPLPPWLNRLPSEGFLILGWVALWHPLDTLLYEWWMPQRLARTFATFGQLELVLEHRPD